MVESTVLAVRRITAQFGRPSALESPDFYEESEIEWVLAAPFRAHVNHLIDISQVAWPVIAYQAGLPLATLRTLLFGRQGKFRAKIPYQAAVCLLEVRPEQLSRIRVAQVSAERTGERIRSLRGLNLTWDQIAAFLALDVDTCGAIARNERTSCSIMVEILAQMACDSAGLHPWEDLPDEADDMSDPYASLDNGHDVS